MVSAVRTSLTLFPAGSSGGEKVPSPPFPGAAVTIPPPIPLLPGSPTRASQSPDRSYIPAIVITAKVQDHHVHEDVDHVRSHLGVSAVPACPRYHAGH
jgi:hypothetical protein